MPIKPNKEIDIKMVKTKSPSEKNKLFITDIDLSKGKAKMVGSNDTVELQVLRNTMGLIFIEIANSAIHTYVVYDT